MRREKIKKTISEGQPDFGSVQSISEWTFALPTPAPTLLAFALAFSYNLAFRSRFTLLKLSYLPTLSLRPLPSPFLPVCPKLQATFLMSGARRSSPFLLLLNPLISFVGIAVNGIGWLLPARLWTSLNGSG